MGSRDAASESAGFASETERSRRRKANLKEIFVPENDAAIAALDRFIAEQAIDRNQKDWKTSLPRPPQAEFDASKRYVWKIATNVGDIAIQLMPDIAPMHVSSTIYLARLGFYDGVIFHRVITGFMAQGGDPLGQGIGGPGYDYDGEFSNSAATIDPACSAWPTRGPAPMAASSSSPSSRHPTSTTSTPSLAR